MSKETIWFGLDRFGFSDNAKAAIMGNMGPESRFKSNNVEDRYHNDTGMSDEYYTACVDNGSYSREDFRYDHGKAYGYGLCQWTYNTRKAGLYDLAKGRGVSISDEPMQLDYMWNELQTSEFSDVLAVLRSEASLREITEKFLVKYENPTDKSQKVKDYRVQCAEQILAEFAGKTAPEPEPPKEDTPETVYWPPRVLCLGMIGTDVALLQAALACHGFNPGSCSGIFDAATERALRNYQEKNFDLNGNRLHVDGIAGPKSFYAFLMF